MRKKTKERKEPYGRYDMMGYIVEIMKITRFPLDSIIKFLEDNGLKDNLDEVREEFGEDVFHELLKKWGSENRKKNNL